MLKVVVKCNYGGEFAHEKPTRYVGKVQYLKDLDIQELTLQGLNDRVKKEL